MPKKKKKKKIWRERERELHRNQKIHKENQKKHRDHSQRRRRLMVTKKRKIRETNILQNGIDKSTDLELTLRLTV